MRLPLAQWYGARKAAFWQHLVAPAGCSSAETLQTACPEVQHVQCTSNEIGRHTCGCVSEEWCKALQCSVHKVPAAVWQQRVEDPAYPKQGDAFFEVQQGQHTSYDNGRQGVHGHAIEDWREAEQRDPHQPSCDYSRQA